MRGRGVLWSLVLVAACSTDDNPASGGGSSGTGGSESSGGGTSSSSGAAESSGSTDGSTSQPGTDASETGEAMCPAGGVYGKCSDNPGCQCLQGATVYQVCTMDCTEASECGSADDFPGAIPGCFPINPGAAEMICALICTDTAECPCGLVCMPSGVPGANICAEAQ